MRHRRLQFIAMAFFVTGFVLAGSGWSLVLAGIMQDKPEWSVCGQDMCSCLPTAPIEPDCPLCIVDDPDSKSVPTDNPKRVPKNDRFEATSMASQAGCASIFLSLAFGTPNSTGSVPRPSARYALGNDHVPSNPATDLPTPPPRI